ncbi:hypothetical protein IMY05_002G0153700 [Salix suchowensis]|nr:hypothetical protein IMY05_002G0153700 [Salix suchowensis]
MPCDDRVAEGCPVEIGRRGKRCVCVNNYGSNNSSVNAYPVVAMSDELKKGIFRSSPKERADRGPCKTHNMWDPQCMAVKITPSPLPFKFWCSIKDRVWGGGNSLQTATERDAALPSPACFNPTPRCMQDKLRTQADEFSSDA